MAAFYLSILLVCLGIALGVTLIGFIRTVWFISLGYTLSIAVFVVVLIAWLFPILQLVNYLQMSFLFFWAVRLGYYLLQREKNVSYNNNQDVNEQVQRAQALPLPAKFGIWTSVSVLYVAMFSPSIFAIGAAVEMSIVQWIIALLGTAIGFGGLVIEAAADRQKTLFKRSSSSFTNIGLYKWVRYPNYWGEIMVWLGNFVVGAAFFVFWWQWLIALVGLVCIVLIMMGSTKRLEASQNARYQADPNYQHYCKTVPVLFPWLPIYSLLNIKVYLE